jgi:hypothetical protein
MAQQADVADGVCSVHDKNLLSGRPFALLSLQLGAKHHNKDIIHERGVDFNAYFRQNAKLYKIAGGQLSICAKQPKIRYQIQHPIQIQRYRIDQQGVIRLFPQRKALTCEATYATGTAWGILHPYSCLIRNSIP